MRNPERISEMTALLSTVWEKVPDWRLGQLFENIKRYSGRDDLFYMEDDEFKQLIIDYFSLKQPHKSTSMPDNYNFEVGM